MKTPPSPSSSTELTLPADVVLGMNVFESIISSSVYAIFSNDLQGTVTRWNKGAENIFGYTAQELIGKTVEFLIPPDLHDEGALIHKKILRGEQIGYLETQWITKKGSHISISSTISPIFDVDGKVIGASYIVRDITAENVLRKKLQFSVAIIDKADDAIIGKDLNGIILSWNEGAEKIFGYSAIEAVGNSIQMLMPTDRLDEEKRILKLVGIGEKVEHFETVRKCKDGSLTTVSISVSVIDDINGNIIGASQIARDVTSERRLQRELIEQDRVNRALAIQKEEHEKHAFELAALNHDLKESLLQTIGLARELGEMRDPYTSGHEQVVGDLSAAIANELGLEKEFQDGVRVAGYLHDIGKIVIPIDILAKPSALSSIEYELVKTHVKAGYEILKGISFPWEVARAVLEHHERLDGSGYPHALKDGEISIAGRILAVADVVDAMTNHRPYRPGLGIDKALAELQRGSGMLYDKAVVDACQSLIKVKGYKVKSCLI